MGLEAAGEAGRRDGEHPDHGGTKKELYDAIEWDEKAALAAEVDVPRDTVKLQIETSLSTR